MRGPSRDQESHAVRGLGAAPAGGARLLGGFRAGAAAGIRKRHDHGSIPERRLPAEIASWACNLRLPSCANACNGCVERFIRTLKSNSCGCARSERGRVAAWPGGISERYNQRWIVQRWVPHAAQARQQASCTWSRCIIHSVSVQEIGAKHFTIIGPSGIIPANGVVRTNCLRYRYVERPIANRGPETALAFLPQVQWGGSNSDAGAEVEVATVEQRDVRVQRMGGDF